MTTTERSIWFAVFLVAGFFIGTYSYHKNQDRAAYLECLRITEKLLAEDPQRISVPFCRL